MSTSSPTCPRPISRTGRRRIRRGRHLPGSGRRAPGLDAIADAPYLRINLDTTGLRNVAVAYILRDIDDTADNAVQPVALQFRVGSSGTWTNVPAGVRRRRHRRARASPRWSRRSASLLPLTANDRAAGPGPDHHRRMPSRRDEWVGIDDISVAASAMDQPPAVDVDLRRAMARPTSPSTRTSR